MKLKTLLLVAAIAFSVGIQATKAQSPDLYRSGSDLVIFFDDYLIPDMTASLTDYTAEIELLGKLKDQFVLTNQYTPSQISEAFWHAANGDVQLSENILNFVKLQHYDEGSTSQMDVFLGEVTYNFALRWGIPIDSGLIFLALAGLGFAVVKLWV